MEYKKFPFGIKKLEKSINAKIIKDYSGYPDGFVSIGPSKWTMPEQFTRLADEYYNFKCRSNDIFVCTHPRSGTTWLSEMIWMICNNLDYESALNINLDKRVYYLDHHMIVHDDTLAKTKANLNTPEGIVEVLSPVYRILDEIKTQRVIKTHFPVDYLPENLKSAGSKIVYVARNPRDVMVSWFHLSTSYTAIGFNKDMGTFVDYFVKGMDVYGPYWEHLKSAWSHRHEKNFYFVFYEDFIYDLKGSLEKLATFLGKTIKEEDYPKFLTHLGIESFRNNLAISNQYYTQAGLKTKGKTSFIREGKIGGCNELTTEMIEKLDKWTEENLKGTDLKFPMIQK